MTQKSKKEAADQLAGPVAASAETESSAGAVSVPCDLIIASPSDVVKQQSDAPFNEVIVECLRILARRGRAVREAQAAAAPAEAEVEG